MTDLQGQTISINFLKGYKDLNRSSRWTWPQQQRPSNKYWTIWEKSIRESLLSPRTLKLQQALGEHTTDYNNSAQIWHTYTTSNYLYLQNKSTKKWTKYKKIQNSNTPYIYMTLPQEQPHLDQKRLYEH